MGWYANSSPAIGRDAHRGGHLDCGACGLMAGVYLAEFSDDSKAGDYSRFSANVLMGMPSIIVGVFAYTLVVVPLGNFSGYAGALALDYLFATFLEEAGLPRL